MLNGLILSIMEENYENEIRVFDRMEIFPCSWEIIWREASFKAALANSSGLSYRLVEKEILHD